MKTKPKHRLASYYNPQPRIKYVNNEPTYRIRGTYGGNLSDYTGEVSAATASITTLKCLLNSVVSTPNANFISIDIEDYYLNSKLTTPEYMIVERKLVPQEIIDHYNLEALFNNDKILIEVTGGMYGLPQAGKLAQDDLIKHLNQYGYYLCPDVDCLFSHITRSTTFVLTVDDFGIKFIDKNDAYHLIAALQDKYSIKIDWS